MPSTLSLIRVMFGDPNQRTVAIGVWATSLSFGAALGPLIGGALIDLLWWGAVFLIAVPVVVLLLAVGPRLLPEFRDPQAEPLDAVSAALALVAVLAVIYGLKQIAVDASAPSTPLFIIGGLAGGVVFLRRQARLVQPLLDLRLLRVPAFSASLAANTLALFVLLGIDFFVAQYLQLVLKMGAFEAGLWTLPSSAGIVLGSMLAPASVRWLRPTWVVAGGLVLGAVGAFALGQVHGTAGLVGIVSGTVLLSLGLAPVATLGTDLIVGAAPAERAGAASAISETGTEVGGALGVAILGSIGTAVYRHEGTNALPAGMPRQVAEAARATLGGAVTVADRVPASLLAAATDAFADGLRLAAYTSGAAMLVMAVVVLFLLRKANPASPGHDVAAA